MATVSDSVWWMVQECCWGQSSTKLFVRVLRMSRSSVGMSSSYEKSLGSTALARFLFLAMLLVMNTQFFYGWDGWISTIYQFPSLEDFVTRGWLQALVDGSGWSVPQKVHYCCYKVWFGWQQSACQLHCQQALGQSFWERQLSRLESPLAKGVLFLV